MVRFKKWHIIVLAGILAAFVIPEGTTKAVSGLIGALVGAIVGIVKD